MDREDLSVPALSENGEDAWVDEGEGIPTRVRTPEMALADILRSVRRAQDVSARHAAIRRKFERDEEFERLFSLNALFYPDEPRSPSLSWLTHSHTSTYWTKHPCGSASFL